LPGRVAAHSVGSTGSARALEGAFDNAENALSLIDEVFEAEAAVEAAAPEYRPLLRQVRGIEKQIRTLDEEIAETSQQASFLSDPSQADRRARLEARIAEWEEERVELVESIPEEWEPRHDTFAELTKAEQRARMTYRRAGDGSIEPVVEMLGILDANADFAALEGDLTQFGADIADGDREELEERAKVLGSSFGSLAGADDVRSALSKMRRNLRERSEDREKAAEEFQVALGAFEEQLVWRADAESTLRDGLTTYRAALLDTVGSRQADRLSREQALFIAGCAAGHRDISLNF
ncbi:MAG: C4-dicarboxylate ABC transporter permease, partial [Pseudomonadota bacterium]